MARSFDGSTQHLSRTVANFVSAPFSVALWFRPTSATTSGTLWAAGDTAGFGEQFRLDKNSNGTVSAVSADDFNFAVATTTATYTANTWHHIAGVYASSTSRSVYLNGANKVTNTDSSAPTGLDNTTIGALVGSSVTSLYAGRIAEAAIWSAALTDDEVASLYNNGIGLSPTMVRPDALVAYWPLLQTDGDIDWWGQNNLTANGSPAYADHVPVIYPSGVRSVVTSEGPSFKAAWARGSNTVITPGIV